MLRAATGDPFDAGRQAFDDLGLGGRGRASAPTAMACANDHLASGVLMQALDAGLQVPADLAVLGFGDFPVGRQLRPALSTVRPPSQAIGRETAQALARALASGKAPVGCALPWQLIARGSTAPPG
jgi:DNA-binding LacI/PurR family transcriptional regulator